MKVLNVDISFSSKDTARLVIFGLYLTIGLVPLDTYQP